jgi:hypothetical protein
MAAPYLQALYSLEEDLNRARIVRITLEYLIDELTTEEKEIVTSYVKKLIESRP